MSFLYSICRTKSYSRLLLIKTLCCALAIFHTGFVPLPVLLTSSVLVLTTCILSNITALIARRLRATVLYVRPFCRDGQMTELEVFDGLVLVLFIKYDAGSPSKLYRYVGRAVLVPGVL